MSSTGIDGLTDSERLLGKTLAIEYKALGEVIRLLTEVRIAQQNFLSQQAAAQATPGITPRKDFSKPTQMTEAKKIVKCGSAKFQGCGADIYWKDRKPYNPDGSAHRCRQ